MKLKTVSILIALGTLFYIAFGIFQLVLGFLGIEHYLGTLVAIIALIGLVFFRFTLPFTIGTFFGAIGVLGLHWIWALIITVPGILYIIPGLALAVLGPSKIISWNKKRTANPEPQDDADIIEGTATRVDDEDERLK